MFNHSESPNVSYTLDSSTGSIRYTTTRDIEADEELYIFYGHNLWFNPSGSGAPKPNESVVEDGWGGLSMLNDDDVQDSADDGHWPLLDGDPDEVVSEEDLPFTRFKPPPEEETLEEVRTST